MKFSHIPLPSLSELATTAVRLGRAFEGLARTVDLGRNSPDVEIVSEALCRLAERNPFDPSNDRAFEALRAVLDADLQSEEIGMERRFFETRYGEFGQDGELRDCPVYSDRGQQLLSVLDAFTAFIAARDVVLDRVAAARALRLLLAP